MYICPCQLWLMTSALAHATPHRHDRISLMQPYLILATTRDVIKKARLEARHALTYIHSTQEQRSKDVAQTQSWRHCGRCGEKGQAERFNNFLLRPAQIQPDGSSEQVVSIRVVPADIVPISTGYWTRHIRQRSMGRQTYPRAT